MSVHIEKWSGQAGQSVCGGVGPTVIAAMQSDCDQCRKAAGIAPVGELGVSAAPKPQPPVVTPDDLLAMLRQHAREGAKEHDTVGRRMADTFDQLDRLASDKGNVPTEWRRP